MIRITVGYPEREHEKRILLDDITTRKVDELELSVSKISVFYLQ